MLVVFSNLFFFSLPTIFFYMFLYNLTFIGLVWIFLSFYSKSLKTLFSLNVFSFDGAHLMFLTIFLFSLAGVPPFIGFFSKIYLLNLISSQSFFLLYSLFIIVLLVGLYFYVQNIRFLHSTNCYTNTKPFLIVSRRPLFFVYYSCFWAFVTINGFLVSEDLLIFFFWLLL